MNAERLTSRAKHLRTWIERLLAFGIVAGIIAYGIASTTKLVRMDWHGSATFYELI